jgi:hypothetical protein
METVVTSRRRLVPLSEIQQAYEWWTSLGHAAAGVDIRSDGVTFIPPAAQQSGNAFDAWKAKDQSRDRAAHR